MPRKYTYNRRHQNESRTPMPRELIARIMNRKLARAKKMKTWRGYFLKLWSYKSVKAVVLIGLTLLVLQLWSGEGVKSTEQQAADKSDSTDDSAENFRKDSFGSLIKNGDQRRDLITAVSLRSKKDDGNPFGRSAWPPAGSHRRRVLNSYRPYQVNDDDDDDDDDEANDDDDSSYFYRIVIKGSWTGMRAIANYLLDAIGIEYESEVDYFFVLTTQIIGVSLLMYYVPLKLINLLTRDGYGSDFPFVRAMWTWFDSVLDNNLLKPVKDFILRIKLKIFGRQHQVEGILEEEAEQTRPEQENMPKPKPKPKPKRGKRPNQRDFLRTMAKC